MRVKSLLIAALLIMAGCASMPMHLSVPLTTGEIVPVVLHVPKAWVCDPIAAGRLVCTNITDTPQAVTVGKKRFMVPGKTRLHVEEESRGGMWL
jgi:hypothetical protein